MMTLCAFIVPHPLQNHMHFLFQRLLGCICIYVHMCARVCAHTHTHTHTYTHHHLFSCCCGGEVSMAGTRSCWSHHSQNLEHRAMNACGEHELSSSHPRKRCLLQGAGLPTKMNWIRTAEIIPHRYAQSSLSQVISDSVRFSSAVKRYYPSLPTRS